jgi:hypothetical protein
VSMRGPALPDGVLLSSQWKNALEVQKSAGHEEDQHQQEESEAGTRDVERSADHWDGSGGQNEPLLHPGQRREVVKERSVGSTNAAPKQTFGQIRKCRVALEVGTHSPWVSRSLKAMGHEVIMANPRQLTLSPLITGAAHQSVLSRIS